tara:strand:+ start:379 stop:576 length:198 start_codon:yes stop_codon:yes gene_type:complete
LNNGENMKMGDLIHDLDEEEIGIIMEVIDEETFTILWPYDDDMEIMKIWEIYYVDSIFEEDTFCP